MNLKKLEFSELELVDPNADYTGTQTIFIDFDGANDVSYDNDTLNIHIDNLSVAHSGLSEDEQFQIITDLNNTFADTGVSFTVSSPTNEEYSTIYVGGNDSAFSEYGNFLGLSETIDVGNQIKNDDAFVFSNKINSTIAITETIAHEAGHLLGFQHEGDDVTVSSDINDFAYSGYVYLCARDIEFKLGQFANHHFILFSGNMPSEWDVKDLGGGYHGITLAAFDYGNLTKDDNKLTDINAVKDYIAGDKDVAEIKQISIPTNYDFYSFASLLHELYEAYDNSVDYNWADWEPNATVCTTFTNTLLAKAGLSESYREDLTDFKRGLFNGLDWGEDNILPEEHFNYMVSLSATPNPVEKGQSFTLSATTLATDAIDYVYFYRDSNNNGVLDISGDIKVGTDSNSSDGWSCTTSLSSSGTYKFFAYAEDKMGDVSGNDKSTTVTVDEPNLTPDLIIVDGSIKVDDSTAPTKTYYAGDNIRVDWISKNIGTGNAGSSQQGIYLSTNSTITTSDTYLDKESLGTMTVGETDPEYEKFDLPNVSPGTYYIGVITDYEDDITESNESNNNDATSVAIHIGESLSVDLVVRDGSIKVDDSTAPTKTYYVGDNIKVDWISENIGTGYGESSQQGIYLSTNSTITTGDIYLDKESLGAMSSGEVDPENKSFALPDVSPGTYYIGVITDYEGIITESNESNNNDATPVKITIIDTPSPDLEVDYNTHSFGSSDIGWSFKIGNIEDGTLNYSVVETIDWLQVTGYDGSATSANEDTATVTIDRSQLSPGLNQATFTVVNSNDNTDTETITISATLIGDSTAHNDFDGNGKSDILFCKSDGSALGYYADASPSGWTDVGGASSDWNVIGVGDFDANGKADILFTNSAGNSLGYYADGSADNWTNVGSYSNAWEVIGVGDFDANGKDDILFTNLTRTALGYYADGNAGNWTNVGACSNAWEVIGIGDFDANGKADILFTNSAGNSLGYYADGSAGNWTNVGRYSDSWEVVGIGDFDANGKDDILFTNLTRTALGYYADGNAGNWTNVGACSNAWEVIGVGDFDANGKDDILFSLSGGNSLGYYADGSASDWHSVGDYSAGWDVVVA